MDARSRYFAALLAIRDHRRGQKQTIMDAYAEMKEIARCALERSQRPRRPRLRPNQGCERGGEGRPAT